MFRIAAVFVFASMALLGQTTRNVPAQFPTIQGAIAASQNGDTVLVAAGVYNESISFLGKSITVVSQAGPQTTIIQGSTGQRVVTFAANEGPASILNGFTITGGAGGVQMMRTSPTLMNCTIVGNTATNVGGGGVRIVSDLAGGNASPTFTNCRILNNACAGTSGAVFSNSGYNEAGGGGVVALVALSASLSLVFTGCTIAGNSSLGGYLGGGLFILQVNGTGAVNLAMTQCDVQGNVGYLEGGGVFMQSVGSASFNRCRFLGNTAGVAFANAANSSGGAARIVNAGTTTFVNCLIAGNSVNGHAAAISATGGGPNYNQGTLNIQSSTIVDNVGSGGAITTNLPGLTISSSIIRGGSPAPIATIAPAPLFPAVSFSNIESVFGAQPTNIDVDPRFVDPANGDYHLATTSPCVNTGSLGVVTVPATDLDGSPRQVGQIDMGSDERPTATLPGSGADLDLYARIDGGGDPLATTVAGPAGSELGVVLRSPGGTYVGAPVMIAGQLFATGAPPALNAAFPMIQINAFGTVLLYSTVGGAPFSQPGLSNLGVSLFYLIPPGFAGATLRLQAFAVTPFAGPLGFVATDARDVTL